MSPHTAYYTVPNDSKTHWDLRYLLSTSKPSTATAADNTTDLPRSTRDVGQSGEVIGGTGNFMPAGIESKHAYMGANHHAVHGDTRDLKHSKYDRSEFERYQQE
ncbi:hypothetical protein N7447_000705 [Penicillium robsamsonii]|uniref:uncharacterized protein n=1 Tax=Penicillium robsamsonii TaxID=1792511 RepID=UPI002546D671|nr:uncharacterized protein N7447_000705 [Penicillium robsamsonii]KAJ5834679.1 hypothetical protein N7447_000705 [Penicillium robsamsonii]